MNVIINEPDSYMISLVKHEKGFTIGKDNTNFNTYQSINSGAFFVVDTVINMKLRHCL